MLRRTHLAIGLAVSLYFLPYVNYQWIFIPVLLISSLLPDIDSGFSKLKVNSFFKSVQPVIENRGVFHTYTVCVVLSVLIALIYPIAALPFFLGYSFHLFLDSFTPQGIRPFWPLKGESKGFIRDGGRTENTIFAVFVIIDVLFLVMLVSRIT
jgi:membrane-bound metal-dependent hydrolase YbcI (DUF457 family)